MVAYESKKEALWVSQWWQQVINVNKENKKIVEHESTMKVGMDSWDKRAEKHWTMMEESLEKTII